MPICPDGIFEVSNILKDEDTLSIKVRSENLARKISKFIDNELRNHRCIADVNTKTFRFTLQYPNETQQVIDLAINLVKNAYVAIGWHEVRFWTQDSSIVGDINYRIALVRGSIPLIV